MQFKTNYDRVERLYMANNITYRPGRIEVMRGGHASARAYAQQTELGGQNFVGDPVETPVVVHVAPSLNPNDIIYASTLYSVRLVGASLDQSVVRRVRASLDPLKGPPRAIQKAFGRRSVQTAIANRLQG